MTGSVSTELAGILAVRRRPNEDEPTSLTLLSSLRLLVLFARLYASTSYAQQEPNQSTMPTQRQTSADVMTLHSLPTVLVVGWWSPFPSGRQTSIPRPYFYMFFVSRLASQLSSWACHFCVFCRMSFLVERMGMTKKYIVNRGVDTFGMNAYYTDDAGLPCKRDLPDSFASRLDAWKQQAQSTHEPFPTSLDFRNATLHMQPNGAGRGQWQWMLKTDDITLYISRGKWNGVASVRLNSRFLWSCPTLTDAIVQVHELLYNAFEGNMLHLQPSMIDLCADVAGWHDVERLNKKRNFVSHSIKRRDHSEGEQLLEMKSDSFSSGLHDTGFDFAVKKSSVVKLFTRSSKGILCTGSKTPTRWSNTFRSCGPMPLVTLLVVRMVYRMAGCAVCVPRKIPTVRAGRLIRSGRWCKTPFRSRTRRLSTLERSFVKPMSSATLRRH